MWPDFKKSSYHWLNILKSQILLSYDSMPLLFSVIYKESS